MAFEEVKAGLASLTESVSRTRADIERDAGAIRSSVDGISSSIAQVAASGNEKRINGIRAQLEEMAASGNFFAMQLTDALKAVDEGMLSTQELLEQFPRAVVQVGDETLQLTSYINQLGVTMGDAQGRIQQFLQDVRGTEDEFGALLARLGESSDVVAQKVGDLVRQVAAGNRDLQDLRDLLAELEGGTLTSAVGERLADVLAEARRTGDL